ncbi:MAG: hypothetical protein ACR2JE_13525 [Acidobacteriaceae bacterium]
MNEFDAIPSGSSLGSFSDLAGSLIADKDSVTKLPYTVTSTYDADGRPVTTHLQTTAAFGSSPVLNEDLLHVTAYSPFGGIAAATLGNSLILEQRSYNANRGWLASIGDTTIGNSGPSSAPATRSSRTTISNHLEKG